MNARIFSRKVRTSMLVAVPLVLALGLAGCTGNSDAGMPGTEHGTHPSASTDSASAVNSADAMFVTMMIPHHQQAIEMSDMLLGKTGADEQVRALARRVKDAQGPEIEQMETWLAEWNMEPAGQMSHGDGMMSADDMEALEAAQGNDAARLYLEQMIVHHEGAIEMAEVQLEEGRNPDVVALAQAVVDTQAAEIAEMRELLTQL